MAFTLTSIGGIIAALVLFVILKRVVGFVFRIIMVGVLMVAVIIGAWMWTRPDGSSNTNDNNTARPQRTQRPQKTR